MVMFYSETSALAGGVSALPVNLPLPAADGLTHVGLLLEMLGDVQTTTTSMAEIYRSCSYMELGLLVLPTNSS